MNQLDSTSDSNYTGATRLIKSRCYIRVYLINNNLAFFITFTRLTSVSRELESFSLYMHHRHSDLRRAKFLSSPHSPFYRDMDYADDGTFWTAKEHVERCIEVIMKQTRL